MSDNPYAPPESPLVSTAGPQLAAGAPQTWTYGELVNQGWEALQRDWPVLGAGWVVTFIIRAITGWILQAVIGGGTAANDQRNRVILEALKQRPPDFERIVPLMGPAIGVSTAAGLLNGMLTAFLAVGLTRMMLASVRAESPSFSVLFSGFSRHFPYIGAFLLFMLALYAGLALCLVPGFVVWSILFPMLYFVSDSQMGPLASWTAAVRATEGQRLNIFGFSVVMMLLALAGFLACCIGAVATIPVSGLAYCALYVRLSGRTTSEWLHADG